MSWRTLPATQVWPEAVHDLAEVSLVVTRLRLVADAGFNRLPEFKRLEALWCFGVDQKRLSLISECESLRDLYLDYNLRTADVRCLLNLPKLEVLFINSCSKIDSLDQLSEFRNLTALGIENFKNVHDLTPLSKLINLKELAVEGSIWTRMKVDSLKPLARLHQLELLGLTNLKVTDESLEPLDQLKSLRELRLANFFPVSEFAKLAGKLPQTYSQWFEPCIHTTMDCGKCRVGKQVLLTGKNKPMLCQGCDAKRLARHVAEFEAIKNSSRAGGDNLAVD